MNESDLDYLRNINTSPGPNTGKSIDPTKPGPDSILHELGYCPVRRPVGNNADEWQLFLQEWLSVIDGRIDGTGFMAVQIAEAIDAALAQSDAEPVAWQYRWRVHEGHDWTSWRDLPEDCVKSYAELPDCETRALYTAPPRPDTSAGLIEAADYLIGRLRAALLGKAVRDLDEAIATYESARAHAADRSAK